MRASLKAVKALGVALTLALCSTVAQAGWYSAHGSAPIIDGDVSSARRNAIDDALRNASLQAGADISVEQLIENGTLLNDRLKVKARSPVRRVTVVEEQENGKVVTVLVRALIDDGAASDCYAGSIKKNVLPFIFRYEDSTASATASNLDDFENYLTRLIFEGVAQSPALTLLPVQNERLLIQQTTSGPDYNLQRTLDSLSRQTKAQFIIVGNINSVAKSEVGNNALTKMMYNPTRTLRFNISVFDVYSGKLVLRKEYSGDAEWEFDRRETVSLRSDRFATSDYGQRVQQLAKYAISDIVSKLRCQTPYARIINVGNDQVSINLGSNANLQVGMQFKLIHRSDYQDRHNQTYYQHDDTDVVYKVVSVSPNSASLTPINTSTQIINIMLDDIVELKQ